jgi:hypothetical protein
MLLYVLVSGILSYPLRLIYKVLGRGGIPVFELVQGQDVR